MDIQGSFVLSIIDENLDFQYIEENLPIKPTKTIKRGQMIGKLKNIKAPYDVWSFEIAIMDNELIFTQLITLIEKFLPYSEFLLSARNKFERLTINCYFRSDYGQIGFQMSDEVITKMAQIGLPLDFHVLSFGDVKDI